MQRFGNDPDTIAWSDGIRSAPFVPKAVASMPRMRYIANQLPGISVFYAEYCLKTVQTDTIAWSDGIRSVI